MTNPSSATDGGLSDIAGHGSAAGTDAVCADLTGILDTVDLPIVVVRRDFIVARFNRPAASALGLTASHVGQSPRGIDLFADVTDLDKLCAQVITERAPCRREVRHGDKWFLLRIAPYAGADGLGTVFTLTNMTAFRASVEQAIYEREYTKTILNTVIEPLVVLDAGLCVQTANRAFYAMFEVSRDESHGVRLDALPKHAWETPRLWSLLKESIVENKEFKTVEVEHNFPAIGRRTLLIDARLLTPKGSPRNLILLAFQDISERKQAESALRKSERLFRGMLDALPAAIYTTDPEGRITHFNPACIEFSGRTPTIGSDHWCVTGKLFHPDGTPMPHDECPMAIALKSGRVVRGTEAIAERPDGTRVWFEPYPTPLFNAAGELIGGINMLVDITDRKRAEAANAWLAAIVTSSDDAIVSKDLDGVITSWNTGAERLFGYTAAEAVGQRVTMLIPPDRLDEERHILERLRRGERVHHLETIRVRKDGSALNISLTTSPVKDKQGRVIGASKVARDITEQTLAREALRESEARYRNLYDSIDEAFCIIRVIFDEQDRPIDYVFLEINPSFEKQTGIQNARGRSIREIAPQHEEHWFEMYGKIVSTGESKRFEYPAVDLHRWYEGYAYRIGDAHECKVGIIFNDITDRKRAEDLMQEAKREAEAASFAKDRFLAVLSHELRTPLTPVMMTVAAMDMNPDLAPDIRDDVAMIRRNIELETKLIDDLLDLSRITAGKLRLNMEAVDVNSAVRHVCETCRPLILEKAIHLHCDVPALAYQVKADPTRFQQILWNLIKNAAKFTPEHGDIYISISKTDADCVRIQVRDTGIGIASVVLPKIFDAFEQGDANITRQFGGMGLGLAITKALVEMHRGTIRAESGGAGTGSTFTVELPAVSADNNSHSAPTNQYIGNGDGLRVLIVEDHADTALVLRKLLGAFGHRVKTAGTAANALELAGKEPFDVIVSDIGLPDESGYDLMKKIRAQHAMKGIAMSGYGMDEDLRKSREAGFSDHIVKPTNVAQLERTIRRVVGKSD